MFNIKHLHDLYTNSLISFSLAATKKYSYKVETNDTKETNIVKHYTNKKLKQSILSYASYFKK